MPDLVWKFEVRKMTGQGEAESVLEAVAAVTQERAEQETPT